MTTEANDRKEILKKLVKDDEEVVQELHQLVSKVKEADLFWFEKGGEIKISARINNLSSRLKLLLIASYFAYELKFRDNFQLTIEDLKKILGVSGPALSRPLGDMVKLHIISNDNGLYSIKPYQIHEIIGEIIEEGKGPKKEKRILKRRKQMTTEANDRKEILKKLDKSKIAILQRNAKITEGGIYHIFDFDEHDLKLIYPLIHFKASEAKKQYLATILYMTALKYCYGVEEISSTELRKKISDLGLKSLVNLSTNLKGYQRYIVHKKGPKGSTETSYRLTIPGEREGLLIMNKLWSEENE